MHADPYMNAAIAYCVKAGMDGTPPEIVEALAIEPAFRAATDGTIAWARKHPNWENLPMEGS